MVDKSKFSVCPKCGAKLIKEIAEEKVICEDCGVPYVLEKDILVAKAKEDTKSKAVEKAKAELAKALNS